MLAMFMEKLKKIFKVSSTYQLIVVFVVFGITGSFSLFISDGFWGSFFAATFADRQSGLARNKLTENSKNKQITAEIHKNQQHTTTSQLQLAAPNADR